MKVHGDYAADGYALVEGLVPVEVTAALMSSLRAGLGGPNSSFAAFQSQELLTRQLFQREGEPQVAVVGGLVRGHARQAFHFTLE